MFWCRLILTLGGNHFGWGAWRRSSRPSSWKPGCCEASTSHTEPLPAATSSVGRRSYMVDDHIGNAHRASAIGSDEHQHYSQPPLDANGEFRVNLMAYWNGGLILTPLTLTFSLRYAWGIFACSRASVLSSTGEHRIAIAYRALGIYRKQFLDTKHEISQYHFIVQALAKFDHISSRMLS